MTYLLTNRWRTSLASSFLKSLISCKIYLCLCSESYGFELCDSLLLDICVFLCKYFSFCFKLIMCGFRCFYKDGEWALVDIRAVMILGVGLNVETLWKTGWQTFCLSIFIYCEYDWSLESFHLNMLLMY